MRVTDTDMRVAEFDLADSVLLLIPCELDTRGRAPGAAVLIEELEGDPGGESPRRYPG